jgi:hypothetical protein
MKSKISKEKRSTACSKQARKLEALIAQQRVAKTATFEHLVGSAGDLWEDELAFQKFLDTLKGVRQEKG